MRFYPLEKLINLHDDYRRQFRIDNHGLLLLQRDGELFLLEDRCPHREHPLQEASVGDAVLECPLHGYRFSLRDGSVLSSSEEPCRGLRLYQLHYEGNEVGIMLGDAPG